MTRLPGSMLPWQRDNGTCRALTAKGQPCTRKAVAGNYCRAHSLGGWRVSDGTVYPVIATRISAPHYG
jgi:hypothetical protein